MTKTAKKGLALVLDADEGGAAEEESESSDEAEVEAMKAFEGAKTSEAKAAALKDFIKLCTGKGY